MAMKCRICESSTEKYLSSTVMGKYKAEYYLCRTCTSIQVCDPYWLEEAYKNIELELRLDTGRFARAKHNSAFTNQIIEEDFEGTEEFLDFGCGVEGLFVNQMRSKRRQFFGYDKYRTDVPFYKDLNNRYGMITSFEVFEHLLDPKETLESIFKSTNKIMIGTMMLKQGNLPSKDWLYFAPASGQHVTFYSKDSMRYLSKLFNADVEFYNDNSIYGNIAIISK